jgi:transposase-like protein
LPDRAGAMTPNPTETEAGPEQPGPAEATPAAAPVKKKRNLPGTPGELLALLGVRPPACVCPPPPLPLTSGVLLLLCESRAAADPDAEVIALSPGTLLATNRFVCELCGKGFQRDQNLQLHRRGHNLPWRLRQRGPGAAPPRRRVYVCPEPGCVHHSPARALGDLTGIKKHFCRKHGEKRWACPRCGKRYAVQADLKAHAKTCGTREYRCDCGTLFTRCCIPPPPLNSPSQIEPNHELSSDQSGPLEGK